MAKRWVRRTLMGALLVGLMPAAAHAQNYPDPMPVYQAPAPNMGNAWPGMGSGPVPTAYENVAPYPAAATPTMPMPGGMGAGPMGPGSLLPPNMVGVYNKCPWIPPPGEADDCKRHNKMERYDPEAAHMVFDFTYFNLRRQGLKNGALAVYDSSNFDNGFPPPGGSRLALDFNNLDISRHDGYRFAVGYYESEQVYELVGEMMLNQKDSLALRLPGQLSSFFYNPPIGFEGTNASLWDNADIMQLDLRTSYGSVQLNSRFLSGSDGSEVEVLVGIRYTDYFERLTFFTADDDLQLGSTPFTQATYSNKVQNHMFGPQLGYTCATEILDFWGVSWNIKGAWYVNAADLQTTLTRGDGHQGFDSNQTKWGFSHQYETGIYTDLHGSCWRVKLGYNFMMLMNLATAQNQFDFNLDNQSGRGDMNGNVFLHGPVITLDLVF